MLSIAKVDKVNAVVQRTGVVSIQLTEPLLHGVFHLRAVLIRMGALSANDFEEVVLAVATVVLDSAGGGIRQVLLDLCEPVGCELQRLFHTDHMQVNRIAGMLLFY